jgi:hypothetical protein
MKDVSARASQTLALRVSRPLPLRGLFRLPLRLMTISISLP